MIEELNYILAEISKQNPIHGKKLKKNLSELGETYNSKARKILNKYNALLNKQGRDINYGIDCYLKMCHDIMFESIQFSRTGKYTSSSFEEVSKRVYTNPLIMEYYMHALLMSQVLWKHHYLIYEFFIETFSKYKRTTKNYLEIGGGHGLFLSEAIEMLGDNANFDLIDISISSLDMARELISNNKVNYILNDVFTYNKANSYDFISMGEVLEHVEEPLSLLQKLKSLLKKGGTAYITTPTNAPTIDHIYLFRNTQEIHALIKQAGFVIQDEKVLCSEDITIEEADKTKTTMLYAAFLQ